VWDLEERQLRELFYRHWRKIAGGIIGLLVALIFISFGFLAGLFLIICIAAGVYIGWLIDQEGWEEFINRLRGR